MNNENVSPLQLANEQFKRIEEMDKKNNFSQEKFSARIQQVELKLTEIAKLAEVKSNPNLQAYLQKVTQQFYTDLTQLSQELAVIDESELPTAEKQVKLAFEKMYGMVILPENGVFLSDILTRYNVASAPRSLSPDGKSQLQNASQGETIFILSEEVAIIKALKTNPAVIWGKVDEVPRINNDILQKNHELLIPLYQALFKLCALKKKEANNTNDATQWEKYETDLQTEFLTFFSPSTPVVQENMEGNENEKIIKESLKKYLANHSENAFKAQITMEEEMEMANTNYQHNIMTHKSKDASVEIPNIQEVFDWFTQHPEAVNAMKETALFALEYFAVQIALTFGIGLISISCAPLAIIALAAIGIKMATNSKKVIKLGEVLAFAGRQAMMSAKRPIPGASFIINGRKFIQTGEAEYAVAATGHAIKTGFGANVAYADEKP